MGDLPNLGSLSLTPQKGVATGAPKDGAINYNNPGGTVLVICNSDQPFNAKMLVVEEKICATGAEWRYRDSWDEMAAEYDKNNDRGGRPNPEMGDDGASWGPPGGAADARRDGARWVDRDHPERTFDGVPGHRWRSAQRELVEELGVTDLEINLEYICELCRQVNEQREALDVRMKALDEQEKAWKASASKEEANETTKRIVEAALKDIFEEKHEIFFRRRNIDKTWTDNICKVCNLDGNNEGSTIRPPDQFARVEMMRRKSGALGYDWRRLLDDRRTLTQTWINLTLDDDEGKTLADKTKQLPNAVYALLLPYDVRTVEMVMLGIGEDVDDAIAEERLKHAHAQRPLSDETLGMDWTQLYDLCNKDTLCPDAPSGAHYAINLFHRSQAPEAPTYVLRQRYAVDTIRRVQKLWNMPLMQVYVRASMKRIMAKLELSDPAREMPEDQLYKASLLTYERLLDEARYKERLEWLQMRRDVQEKFKEDVASNTTRYDFSFRNKLKEYEHKKYYEEPNAELRDPNDPRNASTTAWWDGLFPKNEIDIVTPLGGSRKASCKVDIYAQFDIPPRPYPVTQNAGRCSAGPARRLTLEERSWMLPPQSKAKKYPYP